MNFETAIVVDYRTIEEAVCDKYGIEPFDLCPLFWDGEFINDSYKHLYFGEDCTEQYRGYSWESEYEINLRNLVRQFLRDQFPAFERILVDVSW